MVVKWEVACMWVWVGGWMGEGGGGASGGGEGARRGAGEGGEGRKKERNEARQLTAQQLVGHHPRRPDVRGGPGLGG